MDSYIIIGGLVLAVLASIGFVVSRLRIAGVNQAIVVAGKRDNGEVKVIFPGGRTFVIPIVQTASTVSLLQKQVELEVNAPDQNNVPITVRAVATFKVGSSPEHIRAAAERYTGQEDVSAKNARETLLGQLRAIVGTMPVSDLIRERATFASKVTEVATNELAVSGLVLDSLQISDISDAGNYISNLGVPEAERANQEARVARAESNRIANDAEVEAQTRIAEKRTGLAVREAQLKAESDAEQARSDAAGPLAKAEQDRAITTSEQAVAEQRAILREKQLDTEIRRPADARMYETEKDAEAAKRRSILEAQAEAETIKTRGEAEAGSITAIGAAKAGALDKEADALAKYGEAAVTKMLVEAMPLVARELAAPMAAIDNMTVISTDGASALPKAVAGNFSQLDAIVKSFSGQSLTEIIAGLNGQKAAPTEVETVKAPVVVAD
jgi:flotillin